MINFPIPPPPPSLPQGPQGPPGGVGPVGSVGEKVSHETGAEDADLLSQHHVGGSARVRTQSCLTPALCSRHIPHMPSVRVIASTTRNVYFCKVSLRLCRFLKCKRPMFLPVPLLKRQSTSRLCRGARELSRRFGSKRRRAASRL